MTTLARSVLAATLVLGGCSTGGDDGSASITVYSGREQELVGSVFEAFTTASGIEVDVRYGDSATLAAQVLEEGSNSPADVFFAQDAGALGAVAAEGMFTTLPADLTALVDGRFSSPEGSWVGTSGRARTVVYNTDRLEPSDLPPTMTGFADPAWKGRVGWAPTNASFQATVTAVRLLEGERAARAWLKAMKANRAVDYPKNTAIVQAVAAGEVDVGLVNHYYLLRVLAEDPDAPAANHFLAGGDAGALINVAGVGILASSDRQSEAGSFVRFLLDADTQERFATDTFEYPLVAGVEHDPRLPSLDALDPPALDLSNLADLRATLELLAETGVV